jgi:hypothetical protein
MHPLDQPIQPPPEGVLVAIEMQQTGPGAVDQQLPYVRVAAFADAKENDSAAGRVLPRYEAESGGEIARPFELPTIADSDDQSGRTERADAPDRGQALRHFVGPRQVFNLAVEAQDAGFQSPIVIHQAGASDRMAGVRSFASFSRAVAISSLRRPAPPAHRNAVFKAERPDLVAERRPVRDNPLPDPMQRLQIDLLGPSDLDEAHGWSANRFSDRLGIEGVSFLFDLTNDLTNRASMIRASCPRSISLRASHCEPGQASMPTSAGRAIAKKTRTLVRESLARWTTVPSRSSATK